MTYYSWRWTGSCYPRTSWSSRGRTHSPSRGSPAAPTFHNRGGCPWRTSCSWGPTSLPSPYRGASCTADRHKQTTFISNRKIKHHIRIGIIKPKNYLAGNISQFATNSQCQRRLKHSNIWFLIFIMNQIHKNETTYCTKITIDSFLYMYNPNIIQYFTITICKQWNAGKKINKKMATTPREVEIRYSYVVAVTVLSVKRPLKYH